MAKFDEAIEILEALKTNIMQEKMSEAMEGKDGKEAIGCMVKLMMEQGGISEAIKALQKEAIRADGAKDRETVKVESKTD